MLVNISESVIIIWKQKSDQDLPELPIGDSDIVTKEQWLGIRILRGHMEDVYDLCWSPDSNNLISGSVDNSAIMWDVHKGTKLCSKIDHGYSNRTLHLRIRPKLRKCLECISSDHWPSASTNLNPFGYKLCSLLEGIVCTIRHHNLQSMKQALLEAADNFPTNVVRTVNRFGHLSGQFCCCCCWF